MNSNKYNFSEVESIKAIYLRIKSAIDSRLKDFKEIWNKGSDLDIFAELAFCILTPQSKATVCWDAILRLKDKNLLLSNEQEKISRTIHPVRFKNNKAKYIILAKNKFLNNNKLHIKSMINNFPDILNTREWLIENIKGISYKESSHFLRNIGFGKDIAILDRHILKNLTLLGVIDEIPKTQTANRYLDIEKEMKNFAGFINIDMEKLDFILWYKETNKIFK